MEYESWYCLSSMSYHQIQSCHRSSMSSLDPSPLSSIESGLESRLPEDCNCSLYVFTSRKACPQEAF